MYGSVYLGLGLNSFDTELSGVEGLVQRLCHLFGAPSLGGQVHSCFHVSQKFPRQGKEGLSSLNVERLNAALLANSDQVVGSLEFSLFYLVEPCLAVLLQYTSLINHSPS